MSTGTVTYDLQDTIVAIATSGRPAARGIVRLSGPEAVGVIRQLIDDEKRFHIEQISRATRIVCSIRLGTVAVPVDLWLWPNDQTYTRQPSAELHLFGAPVLLQTIVQRCLDLGSRSAGPGEFTMRAFLAGRLDLIQAEAVLGVIHADSQEQLKKGLQRLAGGLSTPLETLRTQLIHLLADLEAGLDFVEEDIEFVSNQQLLESLNSILTNVRQMLESIAQRNQHRYLPQVVLVGPPNAGKSSLFNRLCQEDRAIVSDIRGTTRDYLSVDLSAAGVEFQLIDTAGIDPHFLTSSRGLENSDDSGSLDLSPTQDLDEIDTRAQNHALETLKQADWVVFCWDSSDTHSTQLESWLRWLPTDRLILLETKSDLAKSTSDLALLSGQSREYLKSLAVSSQDGTGIGQLIDEIGQQLKLQKRKRQNPDGMLQARAGEALKELAQAIEIAIRITQSGGGEELVASQLHFAIDALGKLVGTIYTDDLLDSIFSRFCIGK